MGNLIALCPHAKEVARFVPPVAERDPSTPPPSYGGQSVTTSLLWEWRPLGQRFLINWIKGILGHIRAGGGNKNKNKISVIEAIEINPNMTHMSEGQ